MNFNPQFPNLATDTRSERPSQVLSNPTLVETQAYSSNEIIIKFKSDAQATDITALHSTFSPTSVQQTQTMGFQLWTIENMDTDEAIARLQDHPLVESIQPNYRISINAIPNDSDFEDLWGLNNTGQTGGTPDADIDAPEAWEISTGTDVVVGVIDTGVDYTHPDLVNQMWVNEGEIPDDGIDNDGNGYVDDYYGYDFVNNDGDPMDDNRHGTHVAGTIAATGNNEEGVIGVAPNAKIMALKFLSADGFGSTFGAIEAIDYAVAMGADLTNNSWGGGGYSEALRSAIALAESAGQVFVAAAGNSGLNTDIVPHYPSSYDLGNVISVAATDHNDQLASFSNYGETTVDVAAPGVSTYSTVPGGGYDSFSGTSMATPHVSGIVALLLEQDPTLTPSQLRDRLIATVDSLANLDGVTVAGGRVNANQALLLPLTGGIQGVKWHDKDEDGIRDLDEPTLSGWTVYLDTNTNGSLDADEPFTITDETGTYQFQYLDPGTYTVAEVLEPGWGQSFPDGDGTHTLVVAENQIINNIDFGNILTNPATISGSKWHDLNEDGIWDEDEPALQGWAIYLDENNNGQLDAGEQSTITDEFGNYSFTNLAPGSYTVAEVLQLGWTQIYPIVGDITTVFEADFSDEFGDPSLDGFTIDNTGGFVDGLWHLSTGRGNQPGHSADDSLYFGQGEGPDGGGNYDVGHTAGRVTSPVIDLSGLSSAELSFNTVLNVESFSFYDQATVLISQDGGAYVPIASKEDVLVNPTTDWTTVTIDISDYVDSTIQLQFDFDTIDGFSNTFEGWYVDDVVVETISDGSHSVTVAPDDVITDVNFGNAQLPLGTITGSKWNDLNADGEWNADEPGLEGWTIYLDTNQNGVLDTDEPFTITDENGDYSFTDVVPGTYTVAEVQQPGWEQVYPSNGGGDLFVADFSDDAGDPSLDGFTIDNTGGLVDGLWHLSTGRGTQPGHSADDSIYFGQGEGDDGGGNYDVGHTAGRITSPTIDLTSVSSAELSFNYVLDVELLDAFDQVNVLISQDGGEFVSIASKSNQLLNPTTTWTTAELDLSAYTGSVVQVQFDFDTVDGFFNTLEGWYLDDVVVSSDDDGSHIVDVGYDETIADINFGNHLVEIAPKPPIFGTVDDDELNIFEGEVTVFAGDGNDVLDSSASPGSNRLYAGDGNDMLFASVGDRLFAGDGNDMLFVGEGDALLNGGAGSDQFWIAMATLPDSPNTITDFQVGEDVIGFGGLGLTFADLTLIQSGEDTMVSVFGTDVALLQGIDVTALTDDVFVFSPEIASLESLDAVAVEEPRDRPVLPQANSTAEPDSISPDQSDNVIRNAPGIAVIPEESDEDEVTRSSRTERWRGTLEGDRFVGTGAQDRARGRDGNDIMVGRGNEDHFFGGKGDDLLKGGRDGDRLHGGQGNDVIRGGQGDDTLLGGQGRNRLHGGASADIFVLHPNGHARIVEFEVGIDMLGISDRLIGDDLTLQQRGPHTQVVWKDRAIATLKNIQEDDVSMNDFITI